ncbi:family 20 glycosylhydrolase [Pedobacter sp.]|jgi:hexosaminidase|uniref:glycoside hydrolase family 20 protein n=1 Tax=Pedobacter sp. TaxID=1411316 RepID=UPI002BF290FD|nr:family 20 glycosylhydrolase [Pedobacter sp.]HWW42888.1 family 20 glycosylhydrolase [Pedobacter sp.]
MSFRLSVLLFIAVLPNLLPAQQLPSIIPQPVDMQMNPGFFIIDNNTSVHFDKQQKATKPAVQFFLKMVQNISGYSLKVNKPGKNTINLILSSASHFPKEGYLLSVSNSNITIKASSYGGIFYGIQSLLQTLPQVRTNESLQVPCMLINDYPRFSWRGMHLDVSRHFFSADVVKEYIDLMALYKMNTFHWHLVDDQGWRIEIKKYPKLTQVGAWRVDQTDKLWGSRPQAKPGEPANYGGFYTQQQLKEIVAYAKTRNITIIPEIEMPGHVASAIAAYPQLSCTQVPQLPLTGGNYTNMASNYCAGNEAVFSFIEDVLTEVMEIFPSTYIHIGGDEVDKEPWKKCPHCQQRIQKEGLKNEEELQSYFIKRIERFIISKKRKLIGWDEILEGGLAPEATVMSWRGESGGIQAAKMGHDVVMTPGTPCYFDAYQAGPEGEPYAGGGFNTLKNVYDYDPIPKELNAAEHQHVLGAQGNVWTENISTTEHLEYMVLPRMLALAESVWSPSDKKNWRDFYSRLKVHFTAFDQKGLHYSPGNFTVKINPISQGGKLSVNLSSDSPEASVYYTSDGSVPGLSASKYTSPIPVESTQTIKAVTVLNDKVMNLVPVEQKFSIHKAIGGTVQYTNAPSKYYPANGPNSLTDGIRGKSNPGKFWIGISNDDLIATVDLGSEKKISKVGIGCLQSYKDWIFLPQTVKFEVSADGQHFQEMGSVVNDIPATALNPIIRDFETKFSSLNVRYIRVTATTVKACPKGHPGEGKPGWTFADEITAE